MAKVRFPTRVTHGPNAYATIKKNNIGEYVVRFWIDGKHLKEADYFATDPQDAYFTAQDSLSRMMNVNPLRKGYSRRTISGNIAREIRHGKAPKRAQAMSYRTAREAWKARHPHAPFPPYLDYIARHNPRGERIPWYVGRLEDGDLTVVQTKYPMRQPWISAIGPFALHDAALDKLEELKGYVPLTHMTRGRGGKFIKRSHRSAYRKNPSEILSGKSIQTEYFGAGNVRGSRIKASVIDGNRIQKSASFGYAHELDMYENHLRAAETMRDRMGWEGDLIGVGTRKGYVFGFKSFARSFKKNPGREIHIDIDSHNAAPGARYKMNARRGKRGAMNEGEAMRAYSTNVRGKPVRHVKVECEKGGTWHTIALFPLTPEGKTNAKYFALKYHRKYPGRAVRATY